MSIFNKQTKQETILYLITWIIIFLSPLASMLFNYDNETEIMWAKRGMLDSWRTMFSFLIIFTIHNHILAPLLIKHKKVTLYFIGCVATVALFQAYHCSHKPDDIPPGPEYPNSVLLPPPPSEAPIPNDNIQNVPNSESGQQFADRDDKSNDDMNQLRPMKRGERPPIDKHDISIFMIAIMMIGANLGVKMYFNSEEEQKRIAKLKEQSLKHELAYLRYQINPHFIMNTLNNIHALVDIEPEQAKDSIVDMSRMMRYLLYESDKQYVTLQNSVEFLKKYVKLMSLRYTDKVTINMQVPEKCPENLVMAPLVFIPFVENAFKHGVSYAKPSVIEININIDNDAKQIAFHCRNTKNDDNQAEHGGVGLSNVSKRLDLIYKSDYSLDINDNELDYDVRLVLPFKTPESFPNDQSTND